MNTKQEIEKLNDDEWLDYHNSLVEEMKNSDDYKVHDRIEKELELLRQAWVKRNGVQEEQVIRIRRPRY